MGDTSKIKHTSMTMLDRTVWMPDPAAGEAMAGRQVRHDIEREPVS